jgi:hypothetical protein
MNPVSAEFLFGEAEVMELQAIVYGKGAARTTEQVELWRTVSRHTNILLVHLLDHGLAAIGSIALPVDTSELLLCQQRREIKYG